MQKNIIIASNGVRQFQALNIKFELLTPYAFKCISCERKPHNKQCNQKVYKVERPEEMQNINHFPEMHNINSFPTH